MLTHGTRQQQIEDVPRRRETWPRAIDCYGVSSRSCVVHANIPANTGSYRRFQWEESSTVDVSRIDQPAKLMIENEDTVSDSILVYEGGDTASGRNNEVPPTKRSRVDSDTALMVETAMIASDVPSSSEKAKEVDNRPANALHEDDRHQVGVGKEVERSLATLQGQTGGAGLLAALRC